MTLYHEIVQMRAGATPYTFDGEQTARFNDKARRLVAMTVSHSVSTETTDEALGMVVRINSTNWTGNRYFSGGMIHSSGPTTNHSTTPVELTTTWLDIPITPNTTMIVDISTVVGATQTGTNDVTIDFIYDDGQTPSDIIAGIGNIARQAVAAVGGQYNYLAALADTAETAFTGNNTAFANIPAFANEIIGVESAYALDTAVTAAEEITGKIRFDFGVQGQGDQFALMNGGSPGLGTEVEGGIPAYWSKQIMSLKLPAREIQVRAFANAYSAITGGADVAYVLLWR